MLCGSRPDALTPELSDSVAIRYYQQRLVKAWTAGPGHPKGMMTDAIGTQ
jgi:hypothetical protein